MCPRAPKNNIFSYWLEKYWVIKEAGSLGVKMRETTRREVRQIREGVRERSRERELGERG